MRMVLSFIYYLLCSSSLKDKFIVAKYKRLTIAEERSAMQVKHFYLYLGRTLGCLYLNNPSAYSKSKVRTGF